MSAAGAGAGAATATAGAGPGRAGRPRHSGRRPVGSGDTRARILEAARDAFGERGFDGATLRDIARRADVDAALIHHYFGSKQRLFVAVTQIPVDLALEMPRIVDGPPERLGERFVRFMLELWDRPQIRPLMLGLIRSAATDQGARAMLRQLLEEGPLLALAGELRRSDARLRAALVASQFVGLMMGRFLVGIEPLASADRDTVARAMGPAIQHYLVGDLGNERAHDRRPS